MAIHEALAKNLFEPKKKTIAFLDHLIMGYNVLNES
jgi:hypothetical protein